MANASTEPSEREERLDAILTAYLKAVDAGQPPDRQELLAGHGDLAADLQEFFAEQDRFARWTEPLRQILQTDAPVTTPAGAATPGAPAFDLTTRPLFGDYELLAEIGRGGMGVVYQARQKSLNRIVALKMLRGGEHGAAAEVQRFRNEAETVAHLDHPHIVPIHEVGEHAGRPYFSMKLLEGGNLAERLGRPADDPCAAARLLAVVARAVHHAHQRGVLHRDLKPSNILLDAAGQPHVLDFGLARRVEADGSLTQSGALVGTPSYMAPEQTTGQKGAVTTAADVYGLGAVLYALLTGRPPFQADTVLETLLLVREREPEPPSRSNRRVDRDLETICLKCLHKEPARRYSSAEALAEDLERWLQGEPIQARRAGLGERLRKWARRRPAVVALVAVTALAVVGVLVGLLWHNAQLQAAAVRQHELAEQALRERDAAREAVEDMYTQVAEKWMARQQRLQPLQREFLEKALRYFERTVERDSTDPSAWRETGKAYYRMGGIQYRLGQYDRAIASHRQAIRFLDKLAGDVTAEAPDRYRVAASYHELGKALQDTQDLAEADAAYGRCIEIVEALAAAYPKQRDYCLLLAEATWTGPWC
jgi:tetratricopeptide (TPR) repeat protein